MLKNCVFGTYRAPATNELIERKQVEREPVNWLPLLLLKLSVNCACSHWTATDGRGKMSGVEIHPPNQKFLPFINFLITDGSEGE